MDGWKMIHFLVGILPIFRGKLLVLGRVRSVGPPSRSLLSIGPITSFTHNPRQTHWFSAIYFRGDILLMDKILHQLIGSLSHYLQGFIHTRRCRISSINSNSIYNDGRCGAQLVVEPSHTFRTWKPEANGRQGGPNTDPHKAFGH